MSPSKIPVLPKISARAWFRKFDHAVEAFGLTKYAFDPYVY